MDKPTLLQFITREHASMLRALEYVVKDLQRTIKADPNEYIEPGTDDPSIDVRLCVDLYHDQPNREPNWIFRTGLSDYDPYHSEYCAGSSVGLDTDTEDLLDELINQLED